MSHKLPHDAASLQRLINDVHIRLQAVAMEWADMRAVNRDDILRPYWIIGLRTEIVWLRRYIGVATCFGHLIEIPPCLYQIDQCLDDPEVLNILGEIVGPAACESMPDFPNAWWNDDSPLFPAVTCDDHEQLRTEIRRRVMLCRDNVLACSTATGAAIERAEGELSSVANAIGHLHMMNGPQKD